LTTQPGPVTFDLYIVTFDLKLVRKLQMTLTVFITIWDFLHSFSLWC